MEIEKLQDTTINTDTRFGFGIVIPNTSAINEFLYDFGFEEKEDVSEELLKTTYLNIGRCIENCLQNLMNGNSSLFNGEYSFWDTLYDYIQNDEETLYSLEETHNRLTH